MIVPQLGQSMESPRLLTGGFPRSRGSGTGLHHSVGIRRMRYLVIAADFNQASAPQAAQQHTDPHHSTPATSAHMDLIVGYAL
jgi:hypothetical protein